MSKEHFCQLVANIISDELNTNVTFSQVLDQLFLIECGEQPTDQVIAMWIKKLSSNN